MHQIASDDHHRPVGPGGSLLESLFDADEVGEVALQVGGDDESPAGG
jgi:hypothetical protein